MNLRTNCKIAAIIQARPDSSRLPNKIFANVGDRKLLEIIVQTLKKIDLIDDVWIATSSPLDDRIKKIGVLQSVNVFSGDQEDVLSRYLEIINSSNYDYVIRATGDNPFIFPENIRKTIELILSTESDLGSFTGLPIGTGVEIFLTSALLRSAELIRRETAELRKIYQEHVTIYMKYYSNKFKIVHEKWEYQNLPEIGDTKLFEQTRLTVDEPDDLVVIQEIAAELMDRNIWPNFDITDILRIVNNKFSLVEKNEKVKQNNIYQILDQLSNSKKATPSHS